MAQIYGPHIATDGLVLSLDASDVNSYPAPIIVSVQAYSVYGGGLRSANYTVQFSDDNSTWTTAFTGVMSNNSSCGIITGTGVGSGAYGRHRYWRYVEGSAVASHHPRVSRIDLIDINGTVRNLVTYTSDNCSDSGTYIVGTVSADLGGTTWYDMSGRSSNLTLYNGPTFSSLWGGTLVFDAVDDYARVLTPNVTLGTSPRTITAWFNATNSVYGCMFGYGNTPISSPTYGSFELWNYAPGLRIHFSGGNIAVSPDFNLASYLNKWIYVVMSFDGVTATISITCNGITYTGNSTVPLNTYTNNFSINKSAYAGEGGGMAGYWASTITYNRVLSATEITQNYNAQKSRFNL